MQINEIGDSLGISNSSVTRFATKVDQALCFYGPLVGEGLETERPRCILSLSAHERPPGSLFGFDYGRHVPYSFRNPYNFRTPRDQNRYESVRNDPIPYSSFTVQAIEMYHKSLKNKEKIFAVAPMMDWTDRHCRFFHRQLTRRALLYTEMVVADAVIHGDRTRLLGFDATEHPVALQLGGSEPGKLAQAARIAADLGYDEVNLNVGCPSDRVQSGVFGACLMKTPGLVAECVSAMKEAVSIPVTVKCRIGVDDQDPQEALDLLAEGVFDAGADALWVHARKAWLQGLSPRENRDIPPLDYGRVHRLKKDNPDRFIGINGGLQSLDQTAEHLRHVDGAMIGRAAYQNPAILAEVDSRIYGDPGGESDLAAVVEAMGGHAARHIAGGGRLSHVTRHMVGLFHGLPGARRYRQILSTEATRADAGPEVLFRAFGEVDLAARDAAA